MLTYTHNLARKKSAFAVSLGKRSELRNSHLTHSIFRETALLAVETGHVRGKGIITAEIFFPGI